MKIEGAYPADPEKWQALYWVGDVRFLTENDVSLSLRQLRADGQWYITTGYAERVTTLHGPYPSKETAEMLLHMGAISVVGDNE